MAMQQLEEAQTSPETVINENFETLDWAAVFGKNPDTTAALTWGYYGGRFNGTAITAGTVTLTNAAANYVVVARSTGVVTASTATTNWNDPANYLRAYKVTTAGGLVTVTEDHRAGRLGVMGGAAFGRVAIWVPARDMSPSASGGCAALATIASAANQPDIQSLDFDTTTQEFAQFGILMPKRWNLGTVTFAPVWSHAATTVNFGVVWQLQGVAVSNDDTIAVAYGTAQTSTDTGGTTNDLYTGPESAAITVAGTPAAEDMVFFRLGRVPANGSDTLAIDARLHGIVLYITTSAESDL
jgi:hypothetical protein